MKHLVLKSWLLLLYFDWVMHVGGFKALHDAVRRRTVDASGRSGSQSTATLCRAVDLACVFYFRQVMCLQRSAVTAVLLRRYGWAAEMVIGAQVLPFKSHAWVEVDGSIVNDRPYLPDIYRVLERC